MSSRPPLQRTTTPPALKKVVERTLLPRVSFPKICDLPDQNSQHLIKWSYAFLACKAIAILFIFVLFGIVSGLEARVRMLQIGVVQLLSLLTGVYGLIGFDQSCLSITFLLEMYVMSTATPLVDFAVGVIRRRKALDDINVISGEGNPNAAYIVAALFIFVVATGSAWVTIRFREKLQEERIKRQILGKTCNATYCCTKEPRSPSEALRFTERILRVVAALQLCFSIALLVLSLSLRNSTWKQLAVLAASSFACAVLLLANGTIIRTKRENKMSRIVSILVFTYIIWDMTKMLPLTFNFLEALSGYRQQCQLFGTCDDLRLYEAVVALLTLDTIVLLVLAVLAMTHTEQMGEDHSSISKESLSFRGYKMTEVVALILFILTVIITCYSIVVMVLAFTLNYTGLAKWFGFAVFFQCAIAAYAVLARDRGWLLTTYIITIWAVSAGWWWMSETFEYVSRADVLCKFEGSHCDSNLKVGLFLTSVYLFFGLMMAAGSYVFAELIQEEKVLVNQINIGTFLDTVGNSAFKAQTFAAFGVDEDTDDSSAAPRVNSGAASSYEDEGDSSEVSVSVSASDESLSES